MKQNTVNNYRMATSLPAKIRGWGMMMVSLLILTGYQLISTPQSLALLAKIERQRRWLKLLMIVVSVILIALWVHLLSRPFSVDYVGIQLVGITAVSSVLVVGYRAVPDTGYADSWRRAKWWLILVVLQSAQFVGTAFKTAAQPTHRKQVLKGLLAVVVVSIALWNWQLIWHWSQLLQDQDALVKYLNQFGPLAPILLSVALVLQVFVAAIPGHVLMLGGGYLYGFWSIFLISLVTTVGASQFAFLLAKWAGRPLVERLAPQKVLDKWHEAAHENGMFFFMFAFILPIFPADILNYVAGLSSLSGRRFFVANFLGRLPGLVLLSVLGANGLALTPQLLLIVTAVGLLMFIGWYYLFVYSKRKQVEHT